MLTKEEVLHVAKLAYLDLTKEEVEKFKIQLSDILNLFKKVDEIDLKDIEETSQVNGLSSVFSEDEVGCQKDLTCCTTDELMLNVPIKDGSSIKVPKVIGEPNDA